MKVHCAFCSHEIELPPEPVHGTCPRCGAAFAVIDDFHLAQWEQFAEELTGHPVDELGILLQLNADERPASELPPEVKQIIAFTHADIRSFHLHVLWAWWKNECIGTTKASELLGRHPTYLRQLLEKGAVPGARKQGGRWCVPRGALYRLIHGGK